MKFRYDIHKIYVYKSQGQFINGVSVTLHPTNICLRQYLL